jgi:flagellar hook-associated protein FlgK
MAEMFNPQNAELMDLNRQRKMAELLIARSAESPQGQTVSGGIYVPPSPLKYLANLYSGYVGQKNLEKVDQAQLDYAKALRESETSAMADFLQQKQGRPAVEGGIYGPNNQLTTQTTADMYGPDMALNPQYKQVAPVAAIPANPQAAYANLYANPKASEAQRNLAFTKMNAEPEEVTLNEGATRFVRNPDGTYKQVASGGEKLHTVGKNLVTSSGKVVYSAGGGGEGGEGFGINGSNVNNNGVRIGKFDKMGRYISPTGQVYPAAAVTEARAEHDTAADLAYKLNQLEKKDIKNAFGSLTDYTTSRVGRMAGSTDTVDAQTKVNNIGINNTLTNLSRLKGASSDKEMAQMIKDFPGYEADPVVMEKWVERAAKTTNRFLKRSEGRFGFDTEYAQEGRFDGKPKEQKGEIATPGAPKVGEVRLGYRFKGGDQYDQNNWEKVK